MSEEKGSENPSSGSKSIQDFGKERIKNLNIKDYTKTTPPPPKPKDKKD